MIENQHSAELLFATTIRLILSRFADFGQGTVTNVLLPLTAVIGAAGGTSTFFSLPPFSPFFSLFARISVIFGNYSVEGLVPGSVSDLIELNN